MATVSVDWIRNQPIDRADAVLARHLSAKEAEYAHALRIPRRRAEWLAGRLAAKHAVRAHRRLHLGIGRPTRDIVVTVVRDGPCAGRPRVNRRVEIGISHSADFAVAVCGTSRVGIDLEKNRALSPILVNALTAAVADELGTGNGRVHSMSPPLHWACREAILKYFGFGLRVDPREIRLTEWRSDGSFGWTGGAELRRRAASIPWPRRAWAGEIAGYSLALVW